MESLSMSLLILSNVAGSIGITASSGRLHAAQTNNAISTNLLAGAICRRRAGMSNRSLASGGNGIGLFFD